MGVCGFALATSPPTGHPANYRGNCRLVECQRQAVGGRLRGVVGENCSSVAIDEASLLMFHFSWECYQWIFDTFRLRFLL